MRQPFAANAARQNQLPNVASNESKCSNPVGEGREATVTCRRVGGDGGHCP